MDSQFTLESVHNHVYNTAVVVHVKHIHETTVREMIGRRHVGACAILDRGVSRALDWLADVGLLIGREITCFVPRGGDLEPVVRDVVARHAEVSHVVAVAVPAEWLP